MGGSGVGPPSRFARTLGSRSRRAPVTGSGPMHAYRTEGRESRRIASVSFGAPVDRYSDSSGKSTTSALSTFALGVDRVHRHATRPP